MSQQRFQDAASKSETGVQSIKRRPVPDRSVRPIEQGIEGQFVVANRVTSVEQEQPDLDEQLEHLELETESHDPVATPTDKRVPDPLSSDAEQATCSDRPSRLKAAIGEVKHFTGGLISHPYEATKHYAVMRHSHGLVYYQGPTTNVAITVFSDQPLPPERKLWLQKRGFSGKTGLKVGATLGSRSAWIDVTPAMAATPDLLSPEDERAWQRDISRFLKRGKDAKHIRNQRPIETDIIRIPHIAEDGYFRIVLCAGRKVLCPSPAFRYISTSLSPGHLRGASLSTLPVELGIKIGAYVARNAVNTAAHGALQPAINAYQTTVQPVIQEYNPMGLTKMAVETAYSSTGAAAEVHTTEQAIGREYDRKVATEYQTAVGQSTPREAQLTSESDGPSFPFPITCSGTFVKSLEADQYRLGIPTARLSNIPEDTLLRLSGHYVAWVSLNSKDSKHVITRPESYDQWYRALVIVECSWRQQAKVIEQKEVTVHILDDFAGAKLPGIKVKIMLMAYLRPAERYEGHSSIGDGDMQARIDTDIATIEATLSRPGWAVDHVLERVKSASSARSFTERVADAQDYGQKQMARVPLHRLGVKTGELGLRDQLIGIGGVCVKR